MIKKLLLTLAYLLLLSLIVGQGVFFYLRLGKIDQNLANLQASLPAPLSAINSESNNKIPTLQPNTSNVINPQGVNQPANGQISDQPGTGVGAGTMGNDLSSHNTYISTTGGPASFVASENPIFKSASVPEAVKLTNGDLLLYFVDATTLTTPGTEQLGYSKSTDNGTTWSEKQSTTFTGKVNAGAVVDPSVVELADGRLRMYFFGSEITQGDPAAVEGDHVIYSAISSDGLNWTVEAGERFAAPRLTDPEVIRLNNYWVMYYSLGTTSGIATSTDGLEWVDSKQSWTGGGVPGAYVDASNVVHVYGCSPEGLMTATSADGTTFSSEPVLAFNSNVKGVCDPSPVLLDDGNVILIYKQIN